MSGLMKGKRGLIMGLANDRSLAWGIAKALHEHGAELAFSYQGEAQRKRVEPLANELGSDFLMECDVGDMGALDATFATLAARWPTIDFLVHAIGFSDKNELKGKYADTSRDNFTRTMVISCFSFTEIAKRAAALMPDGGAMVTLTYGGSMRVMPNYNVMGVAKAALEASVRYLANDLGTHGIRVNAVSAGPIKTLASSAVGGISNLIKLHAERAPLRKAVDLDEVGDVALFLVSPMSRGVTGEVIYVDGGYHILGV